MNNKDLCKTCIKNTRCFNKPIKKSKIIKCKEYKQAFKQCALFEAVGNLGDQ